MKITMTLENLTTAEAIEISKRLEDFQTAPVETKITNLAEHNDPVVEKFKAPVTVAETSDEDEDSDSDTAVVEGQLDKDGLPWDARIHSSGKRMTAKGVWARRKNLEEVTFEAIKAELLAGRTTAPVAQPAPFVNPFTASDPAPAPQPQYTLPPVPQFVNQTPPQPQVAPTPVVAPAVQSVQAPVNTFQSLMTRIQQGFVGAKIDVTYLGSLVQRLNEHFKTQMVAITDVASRQDMIDAAHTLMNNDGK